MYSDLQLKTNWATKTKCPSSDEDEENTAQQPSKGQNKRLISSRWLADKDGTEIEFDSANEEWGESFKLLDVIKRNTSRHFDMDGKLEIAFRGDKLSMCLIKILKNSLDMQLLLKNALNPIVKCQNKYKRYFISCY